MSSLDDSLQNARKVLQYYEPITPTATRCKAALDSTYLKVLSGASKVPPRDGQIYPASRRNSNPPAGASGALAPTFEDDIGLFPIFADLDMDWLDSDANFLVSSPWQ